VSGSKFYHIQYTDALGRRRREKAGTLRMAEDLLVKRQMEALRHKLPGHRNKVGVRMSDLIDTAINYTAVNNDPTAANDLRLKLERIRTDFGDKQVALITREDIATWLDGEAARRGWKPSSRNRYQAAFSLVFRLGIEHGKVEINPASGIQKKQEDSGRIRFLTIEEERKLVAAIREKCPQYEAIFQLSVQTGMRLSEQLRCKVGDFNPMTGMLEVQQKKNKRGLSVRYVPMNPIAVKAYEELCEGKTKGSPLCTNTLDEAMGSTRYWFDQCLEAAGIADYTWHSNRHTAISRWVMSGTPIPQVSKFVGHANIQMTMRYSHLQPDAAKVAVDRMMSWYARRRFVLA
jgi:integrase